MSKPIRKTPLRLDALRYAAGRPESRVCPTYAVAKPLKDAYLIYWNHPPRGVRELVPLGVIEGTKEPERHRKILPRGAEVLARWEAEEGAH